MTVNDWAAFQFSVQTCKHALHDRRNTRHDVDIFHSKTLRTTRRVVYQRCAQRYASHQQPRCHNVVRRWSFADTNGNIWVLYQFYSEGLSNAHCRNIIMGWSNAAGGNYIVIFVPDFIYAIDDGFFYVRNNSTVPNLNAPFAQCLGNVV